MLDWLSTVHHDNQRPFPSEEIDEKLEECVDSKSLANLVLRYVDWTAVRTSYMSRIGSKNIAAFSETILDQEDNE